MMNFVGQDMTRETFTNEGRYPNPQWAGYFKDAELGKEYTVMWRHSDKQLVMSDVPMEVRSNQEVVERAHGDVLLIGLGINLINDKVATQPRVSSVVTLERDEDVIANTPTNHEVFKGDYQEHHPELVGRFDFIWFDGMNYPKDRDNLNKYLKDGGELIFWNYNYGT